MSVKPGWRGRFFEDFQVGRGDGMPRRARPAAVEQRVRLERG